MESLEQQIKKKVAAKIRKVSAELTSNRSMKEFGQLAADLIRNRTRTSGKGVNRSGGPEGKFIPLEKSTKKARKKFEKLSEFTRPGKSNLTFTGRMLKSIKAKVKGRGVVEILLGGSQTSGKKKKKTITNERLASIHQNEGVGPKLTKRPFFHLSGNDIKKLTKSINLKLKKLLRG